MTAPVTASSRPVRSRLPVDLRVPALYQAQVTHVRRAPVHHRFGYGSFYWLTDLDMPPNLPWPLQVLARFDPRDHDDPRTVLAGAGLVADRILRLAHARCLWHGFNPLTVYWCYRSDTLIAVVVEVHNTYRGRHSYVLGPDGAGRAAVNKVLYVSPFHPVDGRYEIRVSAPDERVRVGVLYVRDDEVRFTASLVGHRRAATPGWLLYLWLRYPATPLRTSALIRWQGVRLWLRGLRVHPR